jgi:hypothetical protein
VKISIQQSALGDLRRGFWFYEGKESGLGGYFLDSLYADIDSLILFAGIHPLHWGCFHRLLSDRFPFAVYYLIEEDAVLVVAVLDLRSDPDVHVKRLREVQ